MKYFSVDLKLKNITLGIILVLFTILFSNLDIPSSKTTVTSNPNQRESVASIEFQINQINIIDQQDQDKDKAKSSPDIDILSLPAVAVTRIIDGDTIELSTGEKLRYIGINTPETVAPNKPIECFGQEAKEYNQSLVLGKTVYLEKDLSDTDRYGRLLRYVYLANGQMVNEILVSEGYAQASSYPPDIKYQSRFDAAQQQARSLAKGLWNDICLIDLKSSLAPTPIPLVQSESVEKLITPSSFPNSDDCPVNCTEAKARGLAPINFGDPCYSIKYDRNQDGVGCE